MNPVTLSVFYHTDRTSQLHELDIDYKLEECEIRDMTFYHIQAIAPWEEDGREYSAIHCNGTKFLTPFTFSELRAIIEAFQ